MSEYQLVFGICMAVQYRPLKGDVTCIQLSGKCQKWLKYCLLDYSCLMFASLLVMKVMNPCFTCSDFVWTFFLISLAMVKWNVSMLCTLGVTLLCERFTVIFYVGQLDWQYRISSINSDALIIRTRNFFEKIIIFSTFNNSNMWFH